MSSFLFPIITGEPSNTGGTNENCVQVVNDDLWNDFPCHSLMAVICKLRCKLAASRTWNSEIRSESLTIIFSEFLLPATKLRQGYVFTGVCDSVHGGGAGVHATHASRPASQAHMPPWVHTPPWARTLPWTCTPPPPPDGQCAGGTHPTGM